MSAFCLKHFEQTCQYVGSVATAEAQALGGAGLALSGLLQTGFREPTTVRGRASQRTLGRRRLKPPAPAGADSPGGRGGRPGWTAQAAGASQTGQEVAFTGPAERALCRHLLLPRLTRCSQRRTLQRPARREVAPSASGGWHRGDSGPRLAASRHTANRLGRGAEGHFNLVPGVYCTPRGRRPRGTAHGGVFGLAPPQSWGRGGAARLSPPSVPATRHGRQCSAPPSRCTLRRPFQSRTHTRRHRPFCPRRHV